MTLRDATSWRRRRLLMPAALVTVVLLPGLARPAVASLFGFDDLTIVSKRLHTGLLAAKYPPETVTTYVTDKTVIVDSPHRRTVVDLEHATATLMNKSELTYSVLPLEELERKASEADRGNKGDGGARQMVAGQLRTVEITPTQETVTIAGHKAKKYVMTRGAATTDLWMSEDFSIPAPLRKWIDLDAVLAPAGAALVAKLSQLQGLQLKSESWVLLGEQKQSVVDEVTEVRTAPPPETMTRVPEGFRQVPWPGLEDTPAP